MTAKEVWKNSLRGCGALTPYCFDSWASRQLLSHPCCGLAPEQLCVSWTGPLVLSWNYFFIFCFKRIHAIMGIEAEFGVSWYYSVQIMRCPTGTFAFKIMKHIIILDLYLLLLSMFPLLSSALPWSPLLFCPLLLSSPLPFPLFNLLFHFLSPLLLPARHLFSLFPSPLLISSPSLAAIAN